MSIKPIQTDEELLLLLKQNGTAAFEEIYNRYWDKLFDSAYKRLHQTELCEEMVQDIFTKLWQNRNNITISTGLSNYLYTSIKYNVINHYRKQVLLENHNRLSSVISDKDNSTEESIFLNDLINQINIVVDQLPAKCKSVYQLSRIEHKSNKEIASILNISEKTVEGHLTKALNQLRVSVGPYAFLLLPLLHK
jgi:RNA polymerase sigma-70 factor (family 1)